ncbi:MAG: methyltransferase domain-containing protein, partial [Candidatus Obscuribacterales bacterium]|nr:methyltransferase domain-containing protein [Candidatus Obscuribacterales bacterium]
MNPNSEKTDASDGKILLLIGRWHGLTRDQESSLKEVISRSGLAVSKLVFVITAADKGGSKRHPLQVGERREILSALAAGLGYAHEIFDVVDVNDSKGWPEYISAQLFAKSRGSILIDAANTVLVSSNPDVLARFEKSGYSGSLKPEHKGAMPADLLSAIATGKDWRAIAADSTVPVFEAHGIVERVRRLFEDVLLNEDGELSHGRDFEAYSAGMDASMAMKVQDICPFVRPGKIVDKGCGTGTLLIHLSELFPESQIVGMDLSRELLHMSESQHYPNHNVAVLKGNIIHQRFADSSLS